MPEYPGTGYQGKSVSTPQIQLAPRCHAADLRVRPTAPPCSQHIAAPPRAPPPQRDAHEPQSSWCGREVATDPTSDHRYSLVIQSRRRQFVQPVSAQPYKDFESNRMSCRCKAEGDVDCPKGSSGTLSGQCPDPVVDEDPPAFIVSFDFPSVESMIGMLTIPGYGLVDTGAQHGVIGSKEYTALCDCLAERGLKPRTLPTFAAKAVGVGGCTKFLRSAEIPIGIRGVSGVVTMHVVESELPFLLPMPFLKSLGMNLDAMRQNHMAKARESNQRRGPYVYGPYRDRSHGVPVHRLAMPTPSQQQYGPKPRQNRDTRGLRVQ